MILDSNHLFVMSLASTSSKSWGGRSGRWNAARGWKQQSVCWNLEARAHTRSKYYGSIEICKPRIFLPQCVSDRLSEPDIYSSHWVNLKFPAGYEFILTRHGFQSWWWCFQVWYFSACFLQVWSSALASSGTIVSPRHRFRISPVVKPTWMLCCNVCWTAPHCRFVCECFDISACISPHFNANYSQFFFSADCVVDFGARRWFILPSQLGRVASQRLSTWKFAWVSIPLQSSIQNVCWFILCVARSRFFINTSMFVCHDEILQFIYLFRSPDVSIWRQGLQLRCGVRWFASAAFRHSRLVQHDGELWCHQTLCGSARRWWCGIADSVLGRIQGKWGSRMCLAKFLLVDVDSCWELCFYSSWWSSSIYLYDHAIEILSSRALQVSLFSVGMSLPQLPETRMAFADQFESFGPENFASLQRCLKDETPNPSLKNVLSLIRLRLGLIFEVISFTSKVFLSCPRSSSVFCNHLLLISVCVSSFVFCYFRRNFIILAVDFIGLFFPALRQLSRFRDLLQVQASADRSDCVASSHGQSVERCSSRLGLGVAKSLSIEQS